MHNHRQMCIVSPTGLSVSVHHTLTGKCTRSQVYSHNQGYIRACVCIHNHKQMCSLVVRDKCAYACTYITHSQVNVFLHSEEWGATKAEVHSTSLQNSPRANNGYTFACYFHQRCSTPKQRSEEGHRELPFLATRSLNRQYCLKS